MFMRAKMPYFIIIILLILLAYKSIDIPHNITLEPAQTPKKEVGLCTRTNPYDNPPELVRALSLVNERWNAPVNAPKQKGSYKNCIHLIYKEHSQMDNAEGFFLFDKNSSPDDLRIYVDDTYKSYDDILTASLLKHELIHAIFLIMALEGTPPPTCLENEVAAFYSQIVFFINLNQEEQKSIIYRVAQSPHLNSAYEMTYYLLSLSKAGNDRCGSDNNCYKTYVKDQLRSWVSSNPYYQKQCNL